MSAFPTNINLSDTTPPAKPDAYNIEFQADAPVPDPNSPGTYVRNTSGCYRVPQVGGVYELSADYDLSEIDAGWWFIANSASAFTLKLPPVAPALKPAEGIWNIRIKNFGTGDLIIDPNGLLLDTSSSLIVVAQNSGFDISTDGTNYWTSGNFGAGGGIAAPISSLFADAETPSGTVDGVNTAFTLANTPNPAASLELYLNGQLLTVGIDYTLSGAAITATVAPSTGDVLLAYYRYGSLTGSNFADDETPSGTIDGSNTAFTLAFAPNPASSLEVYLDGIIQRAGVDYTLSGLNITMTSAPIAGAVLRVFYRFLAATAFNFAGEEAPGGSINSSNTIFALAHAPTPSASLRLYRNGILQKAASDFTLSGSTITMTSAPTTGDSLYAFYRY